MRAQPIGSTGIAARASAEGHGFLVPDGVECLEIFDMLDTDKDGFVELADCQRVASSSEAVRAAKFVFEKNGWSRVPRNEFFTILIPFLCRST